MTAADGFGNAHRRQVPGAALAASPSPEEAPYTLSFFLLGGI
jgi:hypothetical protein